MNQVKRFASIFFVLIVPLLASCEKQEAKNDNGEKQNNKDEVIITGDAFDITDSSARLTGYVNLPFELGDAEVGIMYDKGQTFEDAVKVVATELDGNNRLTVTASGLLPNTTYYYRAYVQKGMAVKCGAIKTFSTIFYHVNSVSLDKSEHTFHTIGNTLILNATVLPINATDKSVEWSSNKISVATVDEHGVVTAVGNGKATISVTAKDQSETATCAITVAQYVTSISLDRVILPLACGNNAALTVTSILPENANDKSCTWSSLDDNIASVDQRGVVTAKAIGQTTIIAIANDGSGTYASCSVFVTRPCPIGSVDLGLSVFWATCNLSETGLVSSSEQSGDFYAWGEIQSQSLYYWPSYELCEGSESTLIRYNNDSSWGIVDNKTEFKDYDYEDDAARKILKGKWRIPTNDEWTELRTNCTWEWVTNYIGTGINGRFVRATNGNCIFLPAAGFCKIGTVRNKGTYGYYWSSSVRTDDPRKALDLYFNIDGVYRGNYDRYVGGNVRPVSE